MMSAYFKWVINKEEGGEPGRGGGGGGGWILVVIVGEVEVKCKFFTCHIPSPTKLKGKMQLKK